MDPQLPFSVQTLTQIRQTDRLQILLDLHEAQAMAQECRRDPWEFALQLPQLLQQGSRASVLRWLVAGAYAEQRIEQPATKTGKRRFRPALSLRLDDRSCFVLTDLGRRLVQEVVARSDFRKHGKPTPDARLFPVPLKPRFDWQARILWFGKYFVKQFKVPAENQILILIAFQEQDWRPRIDDPLPPSRGINSPTRLHNAINRLNRKQRHPLLKFQGDGSGRGILWFARQED